MGRVGSIDTCPKNSNLLNKLHVFNYSIEPTVTIKQCEIK